MSTSTEGLGTKDRRARIGFGVGNLVIALGVAIGVFRYLPTRWWFLDGAGVVICGLLGVSGVALLRQAAIAERITRIASAVVLAIGLVIVTATVATAGWISGVYGQVGTTGAVIFGLVAALILPYVVVYPAVELAWIGPSPKTSSPKGEASAKAEKSARVTKTEKKAAKESS